MAMDDLVMANLGLRRHSRLPTKPCELKGANVTTKIFRHLLDQGNFGPQPIQEAGKEMTAPCTTMSRSLGLEYFRRDGV